MVKLFRVKKTIINRVIICISFAIIILFVSSVPTNAAIYINNNPYWDCVDSGKHLDYAGSSIYISNVA